jgi:DNA mismatch repair protein MutS
VDAQTVELPSSGAVAADTATPRWASILFVDETSAALAEKAREPQCFRDLQLDAVIGAVTGPYREFRLEPLFHSPLSTEEDVRWRQAIVRDFERPEVAAALRAFAASQARMGRALDQETKAYHPLAKLRWRFDAIHDYTEGVAALTTALTEAPPASDGLRGVHGALIDYVDSPAFQELWSEAEALADRLHAVRYTILTEPSYVEVRPFASEADYGAELEKIFARFRQSDGTEARVLFEIPGRMTQLEEQILERVARLNAPLFTDLELFCTRHPAFVDPLAERLDRELHFYLAFLEFIGRFAKEHKFTLPPVSKHKTVAVEGGFDLALAASLESGITPVFNDVRLSGAERMGVISGPNQGGKTTFARMVGQLHYLARLGLPVPAAKAELFLSDEIFTHFERQESIAGPGGKLHDDMIRIHAILERATSDSIIILNEIFTSTTIEDAEQLSRAIASKILERDILCFWVTFLDELASLSDQTISIVAEVSPDDPTVRTYRLVRRRPDGLAHALAIAEKYRLAARQLKGRLAR